MKEMDRDAATPSPAPEQMAKSRKAFHVEAERLGWSIERYEDGTYMDGCTDDGWQLWQAAIEFKGSHE